MTAPPPVPGPPPIEPPPVEEFPRGSVLPGAAASCALPVVGILLAFLLGLGLIVWSGARDDGSPESAVEGAVEVAAGAVRQTPLSSDR